MGRLGVRVIGARARLLLGCAVCSICLACAPPPEVIRPTTRHPATASAIDADPWALLPRGAVAWGDLDASAAFSASFAEEARVLWLDHLPVSRATVIDPSKDVERIRLGVYATVGADFAMIVTGKFNPKQIQDAIAQEPLARHGKEVLRTRFAGFDVFVLENLALVPLSERTLVLGTEIGVRRVLERVESGRLVRPLPAWFEKMLETSAPLTLGVDLDAQPVPAMVRTRLGFLEGLRAGRLLGNFESPGLNLAGSLTYDRAETATQAAHDIEAQAAALDRYAVLMSVLQIPRPLRRVRAQAVGQDAQVAVEVEGRAIAMLMARFQELTGEMFE
jgi:hypothetical protein